MKLSFRPLAAVVFAACAALVGCGPNSKNPEEVADKVFKSIFVEDNFVAAKPFVSGEAVGKFVERMQEDDKKAPKEEVQRIREACADAPVVEKRISGADATIAYRFTERRTASLHLIRESGGVWKVDQIKILRHSADRPDLADPIRW